LPSTDLGTGRAPVESCLHPNDDDVAGAYPFFDTPQICGGERRDCCTER